MTRPQVKKKRPRVLDAARRGDGLVRCAYCGRALKDRDATVDHDVPIARGGTHAFENLRAACFACNTTKGNMTAHEFLVWLQGPEGRRWFTTPDAFRGTHRGTFARTQRKGTGRFRKTFV